MAAHDDRNAGGNRIDIEVMNGVHQVKHLAAEFHRFGSRKTATDAGHIYMPASPTSPACRMWSAPASALIASGRSSPCVSEITPTVRLFAALPFTGPPSAAPADRESRAAHRR